MRKRTFPCTRNRKAQVQGEQQYQQDYVKSTAFKHTLPEIPHAQLPEARCGSRCRWPVPHRAWKITFTEGGVTSVRRRRSPQPHPLPQDNQWWCDRSRSEKRTNLPTCAKGMPKLSNGNQNGRRQVPADSKFEP